MDEEKIDVNAQAYELLSMLCKVEKEEKKEPQELIGSLKEREFTQLSEEIDSGRRSISRMIDYAQRTTGIFGIVDGDEIGFDQLTYPKLKKLVSYLQRLHFVDLTSVEFLVAETLEWCLQIHEAKRATEDLLPYLERKVQSSLKEYTFYFPVDNMNIESAFDLGNTHFCYFTKKEMDEYYQDLAAKEDSTWTEETFQSIFRSNFQGIALAKVTVNSERSRAEDLAKEIAGLAVDVLKFHSHTLTVPDFKVTFDLNFRLNYQRKSSFLTGKGLSDRNMGYNVQFNTTDYQWTNESLQSKVKGSMGLFASFIVLRKNDELHKLIIQAINAFASALSNWDLHARCASLITILESVLLKYEEMYKMEHKVKQRAIKLGSLSIQEDEEIRDQLSNIYQVRHKTVHKAIRLDIDHMDLGKTQTLVMVVLMKLIILNNRYSSKDEVIEYIDSVDRVIH